MDTTAARALATDWRAVDKREYVAYIADDLAATLREALDEIDSLRRDAVSVANISATSHAAQLAEINRVQVQRDEARHERDAYRSALADLVAAKRKFVAIPDSTWAKARELLKNGMPLSVLIKEQP